MGTFYHKIQFFNNNIRKQLYAFWLRLGCRFHSSWYYINHSSICTTGKVLRIDNVYIYKESGHADIVRLLDVLLDGQFIYCTLHFLKENEIITVDQKLNPDDYIIWQIRDYNDSDEVLSRKLLCEPYMSEQLLEFDF